MYNSVIDHCSSTNEIARQWVKEDAPHGVWISARAQTQGRGRRGRVWQSTEGNLYLSMVIKPVPTRALTWMPLGAAAAAHEAIRDLKSDILVRIKWPNDLVTARGKLGGVLCEGFKDGVVIGVGINCVSSPQGLDQPTTALLEEDPTLLSQSTGEALVDRLRSAVIHRLHARFNPGWENSILEIETIYQKYALYRPGTLIQYQDRRAEVIGLGESAELWVALPEGERVALYSEDLLPWGIG